MQARQRSDGRYEVRWSYEGRRYSVYGRSPGEALAKAQALQQRLESHQPPPPKVTLQRLIAQWWVAREASWKPRTRENYRRLLDKFILPGLGRVRLDRLNPPRVQRFLHEVPGRSQRQLVYRLLHLICADATRWGWLNQNPICQTKIPPAPRRSLDLPTIDQLRALLQRCVAAENQAGIAIATLLLTGLRVGELLALRWSDVDVDRQCVVVRRTGQWTRQGWLEGPPKSPRGARTVHLTTRAVELLQRQRELAVRKLRRAVEAGDYVFPGRNGGPLWPGHMRRALRRWCREVGISRLCLHSLRHANASLAVEAGLSIVQIADHLGHA